MFLKKIQFQKVLSGSWMLLKYNRQRPLRSLTQEAKLCFVKQTKKHLKIIQFPAVWNWLLLYTGAWPELHLQDMHAEWERNHRILKHSTKSNPNKESVAQIGDATSMSNVSESAGKTNIKHKLLLESIQSHEGFRNLMTEGWGQSKTCVGSSPICPGVASASLCIRESSVRGDMGNRSLVFPEFVLRKKGKKRILLDKLRSQWNRFIITERVCCRTADNLSPISLSVFVLITEVKAASLIQNFYTEHRSDVNESTWRQMLVSTRTAFSSITLLLFPSHKDCWIHPNFSDDMKWWHDCLDSKCKTQSVVDAGELEGQTGSIWVGGCCHDIPETHPWNTQSDKMHTQPYMPRPQSAYPGNPFPSSSLSGKSMNTEGHLRRQVRISLSKLHNAITPTTHQKPTWLTGLQTQPTGLSHPYSIELVEARC